MTRLNSWLFVLVLFGLVLASCQVRPSLTPTAGVGRANPTVDPPVVPTTGGTGSKVIPQSPTTPTTIVPSASTPSAATPVAVGLTPTATAEPTSGVRNLALKGSTSVSNGAESASRAIDGNPETLWSAGAGPPQSFQVTLDKLYLVSRIELLVAQTPAGQTSHEVWLGDTIGKLQLYKKLSSTWTADGQTIVVDVEPPRVTDRVMIRTTDGPSFVAWREVRVFGQEPTSVTTGQTAAAATPNADVVWPKIKVAGDFSKPVQVTNAADGSGRMFVSEQAGRIRIVEGENLPSTPFLDVSDRVRCCDGEQGFLGVAFPPDFVKKKHFYVTYISKTRGAVGDLVLARYRLTANPNVADPNSEEVLLVIPQPTVAHHSGHLAFGPRDGYLYVGSGDGGQEGTGANVAADPSSLLGKILRVDVESGASPYGIPPTNPFLHTADARPEIWASGLRNAWQFSFDRVTGDLYIADVGENDYEEVDFQPANSPGGENYGWPQMEGKHCRVAFCDETGLTGPVAEYRHTEGCAIIGGAVYRGARFESMVGVYFYADLCTAHIWGLERGPSGWQSNLLYDESFQITSIGEDESGDLWVTDYSQGDIMRIEGVLPSDPKASASGKTG